MCFHPSPSTCSQQKHAETVMRGIITRICISILRFKKRNKLNKGCFESPCVLFRLISNYLSVSLHFTIGDETVTVYKDLWSTSCRTLEIILGDLWDDLQVITSSCKSLRGVTWLDSLTLYIYVYHCIYLYKSYPFISYMLHSGILYMFIYFL